MTMGSDFAIQHVLGRLVEQIAAVLPLVSARVTLIDSEFSPDMCPRRPRWHAGSNGCRPTRDRAHAWRRAGPARLCPLPTSETTSAFLAAAATRVRLARGVRLPAAPGRGSSRRAGPVPREPGGLDTGELAAALTLANVAAAYLRTSSGLSVTAEGGETPVRRDALHVLGCDHAQGYTYAQPMSATATATAIDAALDGAGGRLQLPLPGHAATGSA
jgi:hypothetical protein